MNKKFLFGVSSSAFQIEGDYKGSGRGKSVWDTFCDIPGKISNNDNAKVACDHIHKYKEDIELLKELGVNSYRFSISWSRILPNGIGEVNQKGINFYDELIDLLVKNNIEPVITLYHWDLPQALDNKGGFLNRDFYLWFLEYTKVVINMVKCRAHIFITFNEPINAIHSSYFSGNFAPGKKLNEEETFQCICNMHKAHNYAAKYIRENIKGSQVSIAASTFEEYPAKNTKECYEVVRKRFFTRDVVGESLDAYLDPIYLGIYPDYCYKKFPNVMKYIDQNEIKEMSHYTNAISYNNYSGYPIDEKGKNVNYKAPFYSALNQPYDPKGFEYGIKYLMERYKGIPLYITENGMGLEDYIDKDGKVHDKNRCKLLFGINKTLNKLISENFDIRGYFVWSILDNFEWTSGYKYRFGIVFTDYNTLNRVKKDSFYVYKSIINKGV